MTTRSKVLRGGLLLDASAHRAEPCDILIEGDTISAIGPPGLPVPEEAEVISVTRSLLHPGLINAHTHGHGALGKGTGDLWTLELLLNAGPWISGGRQVEDKYLSTFLGAIEGLLKGCTAVYDLTAEFPSPSIEGLTACAQAYRDVGMRAVVAPMVADRTFYEAIPGLIGALPEGRRRDVERFSLAPGESSLAIMAQVVAGWSFGRDHVRPAIAPTIAHHCSDAFMVSCARLARENGLGLHSHVQESKVQVMVALERYGCTQTEHLDRLGLLGPDFVAAHGVWLDADDMRRLAAHGASVAHNPASNMRLGNGIAAVHEMLRLGVNVGLGTDGANCSDNQNMYTSMHLASLASKSRGPERREWLTTGMVAHAATEGSARALGLHHQIGRIAPGYKADIVFLDLDHPNWMPMNDATNQLVHTEDGTAVHSVMVGGVMRVQDRRLLGIDLPALARRVEAARERLAAATHDNRVLCEAIEDAVDQHCACFARKPYSINRYTSEDYARDSLG